MSAHTPGPWEIADATNIFTKLGAANAAGIECDANDGWLIADCSPGVSFVKGEETELSLTETKANARLIAAAPDLLEALKQLVNADDGLSPELDAARKAIAKATQP